MRPLLIAPTLLLLCCTVLDPGHDARGQLLAPSPQSPLEIKAGNLLAADLNGDGRADLLIPGKDGLIVLLSDGQRLAPAPGSPVKLAQPPGEFAVGDVNGDRNPDVVLASHDTYAVEILLGDGAGKFRAAPGSPVAFKKGQHPHTHGLALADFNRDGNLDIVTANNEDADLSLLLGDGNGRFAIAPRSPFPCGPSPYPIASADLDADGIPDVLVPNSVHADAGVRTLTVLRGDGKGALAPAQGSPVKTAGGAFFVTAGDLNGDAKPDAVVTHNNDDAATVLLNDGNGRLLPSPASPLKLGANSWAAVIADMDRDGNNDIVAAGTDAVRVFLNDGRGQFNPAPGSPYAAGKGTWRCAVADFNADAKPDIAATCVEEGKVVILLGR